MLIKAIPKNCTSVFLNTYKDIYQATASRFAGEREREERNDAFVSLVSIDKDLVDETVCPRMNLREREKHSDTLFASSPPN